MGESDVSLLYSLSCSGSRLEVKVFARVISSVISVNEEMGFDVLIHSPLGLCQFLVLSSSRISEWWADCPLLQLCFSCLFPARNEARIHLPNIFSMD